MRKRTIARISIVTGTAALCFGVASPAFACWDVIDSAAGSASTGAPDPLTAAISSADRHIGDQLQSLDQRGAKAAADATLTSAQRADIAARIAAAEAQLHAQQAQIDAATSIAQVSADLQSTSVNAAVGAVSLSVAVARADDEIATAQAKLADWAGKVAADPNLTDAQKVEVATKLAAEQTMLSTLKGQVDAASSARQVKSLLRASHFVDPLRNGDDPGKLPKSNRNPSVVRPGNTPAKSVIVRSSTSLSHSGAASKQGDESLTSKDSLTKDSTGNGPADDRSHQQTTRSGANSGPQGSPDSPGSPGSPGSNLPQGAGGQHSYPHSDNSHRGH